MKLSRKNSFSFFLIFSLLFFLYSSNYSYVEAGKLGSNTKRVLGQDYRNGMRELCSDLGVPYVLVKTYMQTQGPYVQAVYQHLGRKYAVLKRGLGKVRGAGTASQELIQAYKKQLYDMRTDFVNLVHSTDNAKSGAIVVGERNEAHEDERVSASLKTADDGDERQTQSSSSDDFAEIQALERQHQREQEQFMRELRHRQESEIYRFQKQIEEKKLRQKEAIQLLQRSGLRLKETKRLSEGLNSEVSKMREMRKGILALSRKMRSVSDLFVELRNTLSSRLSEWHARALSQNAVTANPPTVEICLDQIDSRFVDLMDSYKAESQEKKRQINMTLTRLKDKFKACEAALAQIEAYLSNPVFENNEYHGAEWGGENDYLSRDGAGTSSSSFGDSTYDSSVPPAAMTKYLEKTDAVSTEIASKVRSFTSYLSLLVNFHTEITNIAKTIVHEMETTQIENENMLKETDRVRTEIHKMLLIFLQVRFHEYSSALQCFHLKKSAESASPMTMMGKSSEDNPFSSFLGRRLQDTEIADDTKNQNGSNFTSHLHETEENKHLRQRKIESEDNDDLSFGNWMISSPTPTTSKREEKESIPISASETDAKETSAVKSSLVFPSSFSPPSEVSPALSPEMEACTPYYVQYFGNLDEIESALRSRVETSDERLKQLVMSIENENEYHTFVENMKANYEKELLDIQNSGGYNISTIPVNDILGKQEHSLSSKMSATLCCRRSSANITITEFIRKIVSDSQKHGQFYSSLPNVIRMSGQVGGWASSPHSSRPDGNMTFYDVGRSFASSRTDGDLEFGLKRSPSYFFEGRNNPSSKPSDEFAFSDHSSFGNSSQRFPSSFKVHRSGNYADFIKSLSPSAAEYHAIMKQFGDAVQERRKSMMMRSSKLQEHLKYAKNEMIKKKMQLFRDKQANSYFVDSGMGGSSMGSSMGSSLGSSLGSSMGSGLESSSLSPPRASPSFGGSAFGSSGIPGSSLPQNFGSDSSFSFGSSVFGT